jgi:hypothetical protein
MVAGEGFEPSKAIPAGLQSDVRRSATWAVGADARIEDTNSTLAAPEEGRRRSLAIGAVELLDGAASVSVCLSAFVVARTCRYARAHDRGELAAQWAVSGHADVQHLDAPDGTSDLRAVRRGATGRMRGVSMACHGDPVCTVAMSPIEPLRLPLHVVMHLSGDALTLGVCHRGAFRVSHGNTDGRCSDQNTHHPDR